MRSSGGYLSATRHPWPCLLFLLPLLVLYEAGVLWLGGTQPDALRNGADAWLRWGLERFGLRQLYLAPLLLGLLFLVWSWVRREDRPDDLGSVWLGMAIESVAFALGLWGLSRGFGPLLSGMGVELAWAAPPVALGQLVTYIGAGIYEEVLFRLLLFSLLRGLLQLLLVPALLAFGIAAVLSAALFSAAHHLGPYSEPFESYVFLFRIMAGVYFALLFQLRGFGIAVGAHACYDVLVGMMIP
jgi:hypothetical protein